MNVYLEIGKKRLFAAALEWPGWSRSGRGEAAALQALFDYARRYKSVVGPRAEFTPPDDVDGLKVVERLEGDATTDFGAPGAIPRADRGSLEGDEQKRLENLMRATWAALDRAADCAEGKKLHAGPRGGGRELAKIIEHVRGAEAGYAAAVGGKLGRGTDEELRNAFLDVIRQRARGELPDRGPRGGERWPPRFAIRRAAWHVLDHAWEIEDRSTSQE
jgi:hypothetical protein